MYFTERNTASAVVMGAGRNSLEMHLRITATASLSSNSRFSAREVCSGTSSMASALAKENTASARSTLPRVDPDLLYAVLGAQIVFQHIRLG